MPDDKSEAEAIWRQYYGDADGLAARLIQICLTKLGVVWRVFDILDNESDFAVGCRFWKKVDGATLQKLLETNEGIYFCKQLYILLNSRSNVTFPIDSCSTTYSELLLFNTLINSAKVKPNDTNQPRKMSDAEISFYTNYNQTNLIFYERDGKGVLRSTGGKRNDFDANIVWELPQSGVGFTTYNRNDFSKIAVLKDERGLDQIGTKETIEAMIQIAKEWSGGHSDRPLQYGDISRPGGINTSDHATHDNGKAFDVRPLRKDSQTGDGAKLEYTMTNVYDQNLTKEFVLLVRRLYPGTKFLFNDPQLNAKDTETKNFVDPSTAAHNNHLHVIFPGGN